MKRNEVKISDHFWAYEIECPCCGRIVLRQELIVIMELIRKDYGRPVAVSSGCRCLLHNKMVYDSINKGRRDAGLSKIRENKTSPHLIGSAPQIIDKGGWAWDVRIVYELNDLDDTEARFQEMGVKGVGFGTDFTHVDVKPRPGTDFRSWIYTDGKAVKRTVLAA